MKFPRPGLEFPSTRVSGFTLIELMVVIVVLAIMVAMAVPLYTDVRERSVVRGASGDLVAAVTQAKLEAAKRNDRVTVSVRGSDAAWCIGVQAGSTGCDCLTSTCDVNQVKTEALNGARLLSAASFNSSGGGPGSTDFTIDPRMGMLLNLGSGGTLVIRSPSDKWDYRVQFNLSSTAQTKLCSPSGGRSLSEYKSC